MINFTACLFCRSNLWELVRYYHLRLISAKMFKSSGRIASLYCSVSNVSDKLRFVDHAQTIISLLPKSVGTEGQLKRLMPTDFMALTSISSSPNRCPGFGQGTHQSWPYRTRHHFPTILTDELHRASLRRCNFTVGRFNFYTSPFSKEMRLDIGARAHTWMAAKTAE